MATVLFPPGYLGLSRGYCWQLFTDECVHGTFRLRKKKIQDLRSRRVEIK